MKKYADLVNQLEMKGASLANHPVGVTIADDMLDHVSGGAIVIWLRAWLRVIIRL